MPAAMETKNASKHTEVDAMQIGSTNDERKELKAGDDYENFDHCQACGLDGELVLCDSCPNAFHPVCLGYDDVEAFDLAMKEQPQEYSGEFSCEHHVCAICRKTTVEAGNFLYRCGGCPNAYCKECGQKENLTKLPEQPPKLVKQYGYSFCTTAEYCLCSEECMVASEQTDKLFLTSDTAAETE